MNKISKNIGLKRTFFTNPHGLADSENRSSAYEIALLAQYAMKNTNFRAIVKT